MKIKNLLGYLAGMVSGMMMFQGLMVLAGRNSLPGGEVLILPLIVILLGFGYGMGKDVGLYNGSKLGYSRGYIDGKLGKRSILATKSPKKVG